MRRTEPGWIPREMDWKKNNSYSAPQGFGTFISRYNVFVSQYQFSGSFTAIQEHFRDEPVACIWFKLFSKSHTRPLTCHSNDSPQFLSQQLHEWVALSWSLSHGEIRWTLLTGEGCVLDDLTIPFATGNYYVSQWKGRLLELRQEIPRPCLWSMKQWQRRSSMCSKLYPETYIRGEFLNNSFRWSQ